MRAGRWTWWALAAVVTTGSGASAHRLDECLQAARIAIEPRAITLELDLTPGIEVAGTILSDIDRDGDGVLSPTEQEGYVTRVFEEVEVAIDGQPSKINPLPALFPDTAAIRRGEGTIQLRSTIALAGQSVGTHQVFFRNAYRRDISVYLANALVPESSQIAVRSQRRETNQRELTIDYGVRREDRPQWGWLFGGVIVMAAGVTGLRKKR